MKDSENSVCVVLFNNRHEALVLLRNPHTSQWMPGKWSCPGGHLIEGESERYGVVRELFEETNIFVPEDSLVFVERRGKVAFYTTNEYHGRVILDECENTGYAWLSEEKLDSVDGIPNLKRTVREAATAQLCVRLNKRRHKHRTDS